MQRYAIFKVMGIGGKVLRQKRGKKRRNGNNDTESNM